VTKSPPPCPCGTGRAYAVCCGRWHAGEPAPTAVELMRSRYSAYVLGLTDYLQATWRPDTRPDNLDLTQTPPPKWIGLSIVAAQTPTDNTAFVEFIARYRVGGRAHKLHERSRFERIDGNWRYVDGEFLD